MRDLPPAARAPLLLLGFIALATGVAGGLVRTGAAISAPASGIAWHGALMASAFFGTLIALERAVAIGRLWAYAAPAASGLGGIALLFERAEIAFGLFVLAGLVFALASVAIYFRRRALHTGVLALGALCLLAANGWLAAGPAVERAVPLWLAFFVLTIGGERLELSRLSPVPRAARVIFGVMGIGLVFSAGITSNTLTGILFVAMAAWLGRYDVATRTVRARGITRYIAVCLLSGYVWLAVGGALLALGLARDAALHAILLGFVFAMVFGHAPVIFPAVLRVALPYRPAFYLPLAVLHAGVLLRFPALEIAAWVNAAAIVLFIASAAGSALAARKS